PPSLSFLYTDPPTTEIYTLSLHDALPISFANRAAACAAPRRADGAPDRQASSGTDTHASAPCRPRLRSRSRSAPWSSHGTSRTQDRKSTRLNSSHDQISYAVFCLKKKKKK